MKSNWRTYPLNEFINSYKVISLVIHLVFDIYFAILRSIIRRLSPKDGKIVIIALQKLGDTIFSIPAVNEIRKKYGKDVVLICYPESVPLFKLQFDDLEYITLKHEHFNFGRRLASATARKIFKKIKCKLVIDLTGTMVSASLIFNIKCKKIIGINGKLFKSIYDDFIEIRLRPKLTNIYLDAISPIIDIDNKVYFKKNFLLPTNGKILIHPLAAWKEKEWNFKKFLLLAVKINSLYPAGIIVPKLYLASDIIEEINHSGIDLIQTESVEHLIENLRDCIFFIGNDSGPINIANYFGKPTLCIYGATNPDYTATDLEDQLIIHKKIFCSAGENEKYCLVGPGVINCSGIQCMNLLSFEEVYNNAEPLIEKYCKGNI
jgi:ADP-heptose:LPS heptosyltransferase